MQVFFKCRTDGKDERDEQKEHKMNLFDSFNAVVLNGTCRPTAE